MWHYGHAADVERRMIVLAEHSSSIEERRLSPELLAMSERVVNGACPHDCRDTAWSS